MKIMKGLKRLLALFLAVLVVFTTIRITKASDEVIHLNPYRQVFRGKSLNAFGRTHRDMNIYQVGEGAGALPALCIQEGHKLPDGSPAKYEQYSVEKGRPVPVIGPFDRYLAMVLAYEWLVSDNYYIPARYGVVQVYYWGCMNGYERNWAMQEQAMSKFQAVMDGDPMVMVYYEEMKAHILEGESEYNGTGNSALPPWAGSVQKMALKDGHYELTLDISSCPQLQSTAWSFPDNQWSYRLQPDNNTITFQYNGSQAPAGTVTSAEIQGIETRFYAYIFTPSASDNLQKQLGWLDLDRPMSSVSFSVAGDALLPGNSGLELYRHAETFESNYNIDLEKYCAETNQPLEGTVFNVWEDFDVSQVNADGYEEGAPDGTSGQVYLNGMSPEPDSDYICGMITTDTDGHAVHSDTRYYNYSKTYCMGHPAPEWIECDHEEDEQCSCNEENERLREQWMAEQEMCAKTCDFHAPNNDEENRGQDTSAMEAMLADRDETYDRFIDLEYSYYLQEKTARTGYTLHGLHSDDKEIENVILTSCQAGGAVRSDEIKFRSIAGRLIDPVYTSIMEMNGIRYRDYPLPEGLDLGIGEQRGIESSLKERIGKPPVVDRPLEEITDGLDSKKDDSVVSGDKENGEHDKDGMDGDGENADQEGEGSGGDNQEGGNHENGEEDNVHGNEGQDNGGHGNGNEENGGQGNGNQGSEDQGSDGQGSDGQGSENQGSGGHGSENQGSGGHGSENQGSGGQGSENQGSESQGSESQGNGNHGSENQGSENQGSENQESGGQGSSNQGSGSQDSRDQANGSQESVSQYGENRGNGGQQSRAKDRGTHWNEVKGSQNSENKIDSVPLALIKSYHSKIILLSPISENKKAETADRAFGGKLRKTEDRIKADKKNHNTEGTAENTPKNKMEQNYDKENKKGIEEKEDADHEDGISDKGDVDDIGNKLDIDNKNNIDNNDNIDKKNDIGYKEDTDDADDKDVTDDEDDINKHNKDDINKDDEDDEDDKEDDKDDIYEEYKYIRNPIHPSFDIDINYIEGSKEGIREESKEDSEKEGNTNHHITRFIKSLFTDEEDEDGSINVSLPAFMDDNLDSIDVSSYGGPDTILYTFKVWDHRTEGRIHINKRDLELHNADKDGSYGLTQGDATLEGAVYGLFAAQDIIHPDGKTGIVYNQNDLVAIAATDKQGDASFLAYTEKPGTGLNDDQNIVTPEHATGPENLYNGSTITSSAEGFGTAVYPDYVTANGDQWIGRPLIMGSYYVMELSRSEGYERSVNGMFLKESNRTQDTAGRIRTAGRAFVTGGLSDYNAMDADGSWNDFIVDSYKTENGYDITVNGYPEGTEFYEITTGTETKTQKVILGSSLKPKTDEAGNPVYQTAKGGEYKIGSDGNPVIKTDTATDSSAGGAVPCGEILPYRFRTAPYPNGTAVPEDISKWGQAIDGPYLEDQVNGMLGQIGYKPPGDTSPWVEIRLSGNTNAEAGAEIMDWFTANHFYDCGSVDSIYEKEGKLTARLNYDYSLASTEYPAVYDTVSRNLYVYKTAEVTAGPSDKVGYWITYGIGGYSLKSRIVSIKEKQEITDAVPYREDILSMVQTIYQPVYETYEQGEIILDREGNPIPILERVYEYEDRTESYDTDILRPVSSVYDKGTKTYTIHIENNVDWNGISESVRTEFRAVTREKSIEWNGAQIPYNQYLTDIAGAGASAFAAILDLDEGSYIVYQTLVYPGQKEPVQNGGTGTAPLQVLQRVIKQSVRVTKDIAQTSYDGMNTYGAVHNDPLTVMLGLFNGGNSSQGTKILSQFKFKAYLKSNLENIFVDDTGKIISADIGTEDFKGDVQKIYLPPGDGSGRRLLETKTDGTYDYVKFFDSMYAADRIRGESRLSGVLQQFAVDYYDIDGYKKEIMAGEPDLNSDAAYEKALARAENEAKVYLSVFEGMDKRLAIAWDKDAGGGADGDKTTLQCNTRNGKDDYFNESIMLPYGTYVIAEQTPADVGKELANRHFNKDYPKEITLPFVPEISRDPNTGETVVHDNIGSAYYRYNSKDTPQDLIRKYMIRFNEETHILLANGQDGSFEIYKYGLDRDKRPGHSLTSWEPHETEYMDGKNETVKGYYAGYTCQSEDAGTMDGVIYDGSESSDGQMEIRDHVPTMTGMQTAVDGKFASMLVPWTVLPPSVDRINPDTGDVETLIPGGHGEDFNFVAFAQEDFEDSYYNSRLRIEKLDSETGDNIIHDGALFKIYAAKRDVKKAGVNAVSGTGNVLYGEAVDWKGETVVDADGKAILYPRVGQSNESNDDLPIHLDREGIPLYDESQLIRQEDQEGKETGIFKAYSTVREIVIDGQVEKVPVGYIETYRPLGAGAYVLVEIQAPGGYAGSRPVAFEVYANDVSYYKEKRNPDGTADGWQEEAAVRYQYAIPMAGETNKFREETVSQIKVRDYPSRIEIHKVEDGDSMVGNENILQKKDGQGREELSGGFDGAITVNDAGDRLVYKVYGRKEKLEERGDVRDIVYDPQSMEWYGYVTKAFDEYSEHIVDGTEKELKAAPNVKPLYKRDGSFTGKGIRFDIPVSGARLSLYRAVEIEKTGDHDYKGVTVIRENGQVTEISDTNTGTHKEIRVTGPDNGPAGLDVWDSVMVDNLPVNLYFYDLTRTDTREDPVTGELIILDQRGNELCYADSQTGMAYVYDDYDRMLAYTADREGNKELVRSIQVLENENGQTIYEDKTTVDDENGLPIYYIKGNVVTKEESWVTDDSSDPYGKPENTGAVHTITRLPFGAYILQEEGVPYDQGYIQAKHMGLVLSDTDEMQKYFMQNEFTKTALAKLDVRTQAEIQGAEMTLYRAVLDENGNPYKDENGIYRAGAVYTSWISGFEYDDNGILKLDEHGQRIPTSEPHWIDHIPAGCYVLEETVCPYEQGYVKSASVNVDVLETGNVQSFEMEDDFTAIDILKYDTKNGDVVYEDSKALLTLYRSALDDRGEPVIEDGIPQYDESGRIFTFRAATYKDGQDVAATGRVESDAGGNNPIMKYDYDYRKIPGTYQGRYYYTEHGRVRLEYLPVGHYVLVETENPAGYATSVPVLINIEETGHLKEIQYAKMGDKPLQLEVSKTNIAGGREVNGAKLAIYPVDEGGNISNSPLLLHQPAENGKYQDMEAVWVSGLDGRYTEDEGKNGLIPDGFKEGDLKPHKIEYIPEGDYILRELTTPYGFLQSEDIPFTITDSRILQTVEMTDEIPTGILKLTKSDTDCPDEKLQGAEFSLVNQTTGTVCGNVTTDVLGQAQFAPQPIGYMDQNGDFRPYTYVCRETKAAAGHMLTLKPYEFQFEYRNELTDIIVIEYNPANDSNRVVTDKMLGDTQEMLEGVTLRIEQKHDREWEPVEEWVTGKQSHYTKDLRAGDYRLIEVKAAEGFELLAKPIEFTITDGMEEIPHLIMRNYTTIVDVEKISADSGALLAGARLQLIEKAGNTVVREWTSEAGKAQRFYGLKPGTYIIHELQAPLGYKRAEDREIVVEEWKGSEKAPWTEQGQDLQNMVQILRFENRTASSGGGGGDNPRPKIEYIQFKKTDVSGKVLQGAEFTFYDQTGHVMGTSVSDANGIIRIQKPENGTYTFKETKAPGGYALNPDIFSFTISGDDIVRGTYEIINRELEVTVTKLDGDSGIPLIGAEFHISEKWNDGKEKKDESGEGHGIDYRIHGEPGGEAITGSDGTFSFHPSKPGIYVIYETKAPQGYQLPEETHEITVAQDGGITGDTTVYNWKEKLPVRKIGSITAVYKVKNRFGKGTYHFGRGQRNKVRTGDELPLEAAALISVLCMTGLAVCIHIKRKQQWNTGKKAAAVMLLFIPLAAVLVFDAMAEEADGSDTIFVSGQVVYQSMEAMEPVPQTAWISARDDLSGTERPVLLPLAEYYFSDKHWEPGFRMDVTVSEYGAGHYEFGKIRMEVNEDEIGNMLSGYEKELLSRAGLDPENYKIETLRWAGDVYEKDGIRYRNLEAVGDKMVADCIAVYRGEVNRNVFINEHKNPVGASGGLETGKEVNMEVNMEVNVEANVEANIEANIEAEMKAEMDNMVPLAETSGDIVSPLTLWMPLPVLVCIFIIYFVFTLVLLLKQRTRQYGMRLVTAIFLMGTVFSIHFLIKAGMSYAGGRRGYRMIQDKAYGIEHKAGKDEDTGEGFVPGSLASERVPGSSLSENPVSHELLQQNPPSGGSSETSFLSGASSGHAISPYPPLNETFLFQENPEYQFWLAVPGTEINYPVVQHEDNQYYLDHNFNQEQHISGCIFADSASIPLSAGNTILYGHNMKDGSMFADLKKYQDESFYREHPSIYIFYNGNWLECPVFSCQFRHQNDAGAYRSNLMKEEWKPYLEEMGEASVYKTGIDVNGDEKLITLSTCYGKDKYLIVQALLRDM